jgi:hypothetical protein
MYATLEQRREAREAVSHPGKFEAEPPITAILYDMSLDGGGDDLTSDGDGYWVERFGKRLLEGTSQGFVTSERFASEDAAQEWLEAIRGKIEPWRSP